MFVLHMLPGFLVLLGLLAVVGAVPQVDFWVRFNLQNFTVTAKTFIDIAIDDAPVGRIVFGLFAAFTNLSSRYGEVAPLATENFRGLCAGEYNSSYRNKVLTYKGTRLQRIIPKFVVQGVLKRVTF